MYWPFQEERNTAVECNSDESHTPGMVTHITYVIVIAECHPVFCFRHLLCEDCEAGAERLHLGRTVAASVQAVRQCE